MYDAIDSRLIPPHMRCSMIQYACAGTPPGGFLSAVYSNDLMEAAGRADATNIRILAAYAAVCYSWMPRGSVGSSERVRAWCEKMRDAPSLPLLEKFPAAWADEVRETRRLIESWPEPAIGDGEPTKEAPVADTP